MNRRQSEAWIYKRFTEESEKTELSAEQVAGFIEHGSLTLSPALPADCFTVVRAVCEKALRQPLPLTRPIRDPRWHNTEKVTMFRKPHGIKQQSHGLSWLLPELEPVAQWADATIRKLGASLVGEGLDKTGLQLAQHSSLRAIVNRMNGTHEDPAILAVHTDPEKEHGANASLTVGVGMDLMTGEIVAANTLNIYACHDTAEMLGILQPRHGFSSETTRMSLVFTRFIG